MQIAIKRAYDMPSANDGYRVLVDRLWPRGMKRELLALNEWCKDVAPSSELRQWFNHESDKFEDFTVRYLEELRQSSAPHELLKRAESHIKLTLIYAAKDPVTNHAVVLRDYLERLAK